MLLALSIISVGKTGLLGSGKIAAVWVVSLFFASGCADYVALLDAGTADDAGGFPLTLIPNPTPATATDRHTTMPVLSSRLG